jgi:uncharacterized metal-binding protein YceD (DUF177 family)
VEGLNGLNSTTANQKKYFIRCIKNFILLQSLKRGNVMNYLSQYTIPFSGLKEGKHLFDFSADQRFFAGFGESEIERGSVTIQVELEKRTTYLRLLFKVEGEVELICDRCLEPYLQPIKSKYPMLVKFSETEADDGDEVIYIHPGSHQVEVAKLIYEFIVLSIPIRHVHPDDEDGESRCDPEMLQKLDEFKAPDLQDNDPVDPRWDDLRKIIGN